MDISYLTSKFKEKSRSTLTRGVEMYHDRVYYYQPPQLPENQTLFDSQHGYQDHVHISSDDETIQASQTGSGQSIPNAKPRLAHYYYDKPTPYRRLGSPENAKLYAGNTKSKVFDFMEKLNIQDQAADYVSTHVNKDQAKSFAKQYSKDTGKYLFQQIKNNFKK
ncbi:uncharacterized protein ASCRUDRAFT_70803 [Ascoidea rubescens DSM 1968]|uniref:Uncharacterized protein n=1 Tax=Ascoidea rubescens DSM 1968 TaxID=1344418 RepID=A0A1D2VF60_9ASCO|nr:hypothetical protein ASCRUDRAFT_70803 [Ascoidea rubescens DSM 1968]ODV60266.1 hypothetical protein ASCRUDRAFT_70803 [Ascoidea rubescens DSM 1968]